MWPLETLTHFPKAIRKKIENPTARVLNTVPSGPILTPAEGFRPNWDSSDRLLPEPSERLCVPGAGKVPPTILKMMVPSR
jgi:hypothetical protein